MGHRSLRANVSALYPWLPWRVYLAIVGRRRWHKALLVKVWVGRLLTMDNVGNINSPAADITQLLRRRPQETVAVGRSRQWTQTCSTAVLHETISRCRVTDRYVYRQSQQQTTAPVSGQWSQNGRWSAALVQRFTSTITCLESTRRCWLAR